MPRPTETALKLRARALLEAMTERARWIYALPRGEGPEAAQAVALAKGLREVERDGAAAVTRWEGEGVSLVLFDSADLDVALVEASGAEAPKALSEILDRTGFYAQSKLISTALDVRDPEAPKALKTLAHMVVVWDSDWADLFLLHLASPDPIVRHEAALALSVAVMVARDAGPARALLDEAIRRETYPKLRETLGEVLNLVNGLTGGPVEMPST